MHQGSTCLLEVTSRSKKEGGVVGMCLEWDILMVLVFQEGCKAQQEECGRERIPLLYS